MHFNAFYLWNTVQYRVSEHSEPRTSRLKTTSKISILPFTLFFISNLLLKKKKKKNLSLNFNLLNDSISVMIDAILKRK